MALHQAGSGRSGPERVRGFRLTEVEVEHGCREIGVEGELDLAVAGRLQAAIERLESSVTLIDLAACEFIDSTGIAVIVRAHRERAREGRRIVLHSPNDKVLRVLTVTGLLGTGLVFPDRDAALATAVPSS